MKILRTCMLVAVMALVIPSVSFAQADSGFSRQGIFGCSRNAAALSGSVGSFSATGGVYVPVADYTVELNTGTLVYLQCVLRGIVNRESESASTALIKQQMQFITSGKDGNAMFRVNVRVEQLEAGDRVALRDLGKWKNASDSLTKAMGGSLVSVAVKSYTESRQPMKQLQCPYNIDLNRCFAGDDQSDACINAQADSRCSKRFAPIFISNSIDSNIARENAAIDQELQQGGGFYSKSRVDENGDLIVETPSSAVQSTAIQAITSGFRKIENANDVDQMVGALYAGLGTQVLTGSGGLTGIAKAIGSGASYLSKMTSESQTGLRNAAANAALQVLAAARGIEAQYLQVVSNMANTLTQTAAQLRSAENQCWNLIIYNDTAKHVCAAAPTGNTCTGVSGATIRIATSTQFSQPIITAQISPVATQITQNAQKSQQALSTIDQLIRGVANTGSLDAQRLALVQLDQLVAQGKLHQQADVTAAQQQQGAVNDTMSQLVNQTKTLWADNTDPNQGWCNVNNQAVIDMWDQRWR